MRKSLCFLVNSAQDPTQGIHIDTRNLFAKARSSSRLE